MGSTCSASGAGTGSPGISAPRCQRRPLQCPDTSPSPRSPARSALSMPTRAHMVPEKSPNFQSASRESDRTRRHSEKVPIFSTVRATCRSPRPGPTTKATNNHQRQVCVRHLYKGDCPIIMYLGRHLSLLDRVPRSWRVVGSMHHASVNQTMLYLYAIQCDASFVLSIQCVHNLMRWTICLRWINGDRRYSVITT